MNPSEEVMATSSQAEDNSDPVKSEVTLDPADKFRMWSALSFALMLIGVGVPLWWKTTEVCRAALPYDEIVTLEPSSARISMELHIHTQYPTLYNTISRDLISSFKNLNLYSIKIKPVQIDIGSMTVDEIEKNEQLHPKIPGQLLLIEVPEIAKDTDILLSSKRIIYFTHLSKRSTLRHIILNWILQEEDLRDKINSIVVPNNTHSEERTTMDRLRAALNYDVVFTVVHADPANINLKWDVKSAIHNYVEPLLNQISEVGEHKAKSQWLYMIDLSQWTTFQPEQDKFFIKYEDLPHIITPLEKRLGSGVSAVACIQMVLYVTRCSLRPLYFVSEGDIPTTWMVAPSWGAIQILNPSEDQCVNYTALVPASNVMATFVSQLHSLLGFSNPEMLPGVEVHRRKGPLLLEWQLDSLYRMRCIEQLTSASLTLQSLAKLLGEISNIVISEEVAGCVREAVDQIALCHEALKAADLAAALRHSRSAFANSNKAFSHPSLLALLYFPDDQKYAVYIPLFLPIMIPVLMSLKPIYRWVFGKKSLLKIDVK